MDPAIWPALSALLGAVVGGGISYALNRQQFRNQLRILQEQHKVEFMAEETARHFLELRGKLWYRTGDVVRVDRDGWVFFQDRSVDIIKHKGYRVAASKVDNALQEHHAVVASCTIGIPDAAVGERIKSFVVVKQGTKGVDGQALIRWCRDRLAPYEVPQYIEFRDMLPKSRVGKILRRELRSGELRKREGPAG